MQFHQRTLRLFARPITNQSLPSNNSQLLLQHFPGTLTSFQQVFTRRKNLPQHFSPPFPVYLNPSDEWMNSGFRDCEFIPHSFQLEFHLFSTHMCVVIVYSTIFFFLQIAEKKLRWKYSKNGRIRYEEYRTPDKRKKLSANSLFRLNSEFADNLII